MIEQSELDAATAAIHTAFEDRPAARDDRAAVGDRDTSGRRDW